MKTRRNGIRADLVQVPTSRKLRILFLGDPGKGRTNELVDQLSLKAEGQAEVLGHDLTRSQAPISQKPDLVVVLGGDGAMLATSRRLGRRQVPVLGVNLGKVGFLAAVSPDRAESVLGLILDGTAPLEDHAMMEVKLRRDGEVLAEDHVLNEVVVDSPASNMIDVGLYVNRRPACIYRGDGIIVATATGSTAYSLAAGGPILSPKLDAFVVTPLAPHMLTQRPLVLPGDRVASLRVGQNARMTVDGHLAHPVKEGDVIRIGPSSRRFQLVVDPDANFFDRLRSKLHWGRAPGSG